MLRLGQRRAECDRLRGHFARTPVLVTISTSNCCFIVAILFIVLCIFVDFFYWCIFKMIKVDLFSRSKFSLLSFEQPQTFPGVTKIMPNRFSRLLDTNTQTPKPNIYIAGCLFMFLDWPRMYRWSLNYRVVYLCTFLNAHAEWGLTVSIVHCAVPIYMQSEYSCF